MNDADGRPDPDRLLDRVQHAENRNHRGQLKIFLGYAAGVGKTYAMLQAAQGKRAAGVDVVVGYVEAHGRAETDALLRDLERVPPKRIEHRGVSLVEMDLDAVLLRAPKLALIDELAHTNAPRSRHPKRWQDVEEILAAGIDVFTTLNVQHLESLNDVVAQLTGVLVRETIPDRLLDEAAEIELVDLPITELQERIEQGKVYSKEAAREARQSFFREGNLFALRELALRRAADRVDAEVKGYLDLHSIVGPHAARERLLVCVSPSPLSERLVRSACRLAQSLDAEWHAIYVESPRDVSLAEVARRRISATLRLAEELGAKARMIPGRGVAKAVAEYARANHVTRIVVGKPMRNGLSDWASRSLVDAIIRESGAIDVHVIRSAGPAVPEPQVGKPAPLTLVPLEIATCSIVVALVTLIGIGLRTTLEATNLAMLYLIVVVVVSLRFHRTTALITALLSVVGFDFFLVPPYGTLVVADAEYVVTFAALLVVALVTSGLRSQAREQTAAAMRREAQTTALFECSRALGAVTDESGMVRALSEQVGSTFRDNVAVWLPGADGVKLHDASTPFPSQVFERSVAQWVFTHGRPAGRGTDTLAGIRSVHVPMRSGETTRGVLSLFRADDATELSLDEGRLLESFATQGAAALERLDLASSRSRVQLAEERERLKTTLLDSVSHDLRTPLASITGAISSLRDDHDLLDDAARDDLLETAATEAARLNRLVGDLLDMTRLQAGGVVLRRAPCDLQDLIGSALEQLSTELRGHEPHVTSDSALPFVPLDFALASQAVVNVVANALRYSPRESPIEIGLHSADGFAEIEVADRGCGIPAEELERVFEKFHRVARTPEDRGSGLGLSITRAIVEAHGGSVRAENRVGGGTRILLRFPLAASSDPKGGARS